MHDADVIVIGTGAFGCGAAWHLAQRGVDVLVLEAADRPATQASRAAAGFVTSWSAVHEPQWGRTEWEMQRYGIEFYTRLARDCGREIGFHSCGIVYIYLTDEAWREVQPRIETARGFGTHLEILTPDRAVQIIPQIQFAQTRGMLFDPRAIRLRAAEAIPALAAELVEKGVRIQFNTTVNRLLRDGRVTTGVTTSEGEFRSRHVVVAAGAWSRPLVETLGVACPAQPRTETRYTTRPLPGLGPQMPLLIFSDCHWFYMREEHGGLLIGGFEDDPLPADRIVDPHNPPRADEIESRQPHRVREFVREIEQVMPVLIDAEVDQTMGGLPTFTDDVQFIAGAVTGFDGLYILAACQEGGITHGPGLGRMIADLIVDGHSDWYRDAYQIERFADQSARS